jgi:hypothetical protein
MRTVAHLNDAAAWRRPVLAQVTPPEFPMDEPGEKRSTLEMCPEGMSANLRALRRCPNQGLHSRVPTGRLAFHEITYLIRIDKMLPRLAAITCEFIFVREAPDDHVVADHDREVKSSTQPELPLRPLALLNGPSLVYCRCVLRVFWRISRAIHRLAAVLWLRRIARNELTGMRLNTIYKNSSLGC